MNKSEIAGLLDEALKPAGFKRKGNYWVDNKGELTRLVNLQKSDFGDFFYINFGYVLKIIPLGMQRMHVYNRLTSIDFNERARIQALLNWENEIRDYERETHLREVLNSNLLPKIQSVNSEDDLLRELKARPNLNAVPLNVRNYFGLE